MSSTPVLSRITFPRLSAAAFQHYDDVRATETLRRMPVFGTIMKFLSEKYLEKAAHLHHLSFCIRLGTEQGGDLYRQFVRAAETLSIPALPELYISPEPVMNAFAMGMKRTTIVLTRGLVEAMNPQEILAVMAHELGHVKCEHMVNKTVASLIAEFGAGLLAELIPGAGPALTMLLQAKLMDWSRKAELSCDRAALLVVQDAKVIASVLAKLGGWPAALGEINLQCLVDQAKDYDGLDDDTVAAALKLIGQMESSVYLTHPLPIHRVRTILRWSESDQYRGILAGQYAQSDEANALPRHDCGAEIQPGDVWCTTCGKKLETLPAAGGRACANCGAAIYRSEDRHCRQCGRDLQEPGAVLEL
jgi:Zn-dependent protease with chaperone function/predicted RNA-binding Zn-ribbon protein involved in translation (DUF1610 family)